MDWWSEAAFTKGIKLKLSQTRLNFSVYSCKRGLIFPSTWAWSLSWIPTQGFKSAEWQEADEWDADCLDYP